MHFVALCLRQLNQQLTHILVEVLFKFEHHLRVAVLNQTFLQYRWFPFFSFLTLPENSQIFVFLVVHLYQVAIFIEDALILLELIFILHIDEKADNHSAEVLNTHIDAHNDFKQLLISQQRFLQTLIQEVRMKLDNLINSFYRFERFF